METPQVSFPQIVTVSCGIDVHQDVIVATIRRSNTDYETRVFKATTGSLKELRSWCVESRVTHGAMESTGIYWKPVFNILESAMDLILVNARHVKNIPGHKTDKKDSEWLSKWLLAGLLKPSFIPPREIRDLRDVVRYKRKIVQQISAEQNRIYKFLEDANVKLSSVIKADSVSGQKIINALIDGCNDVEVLLKFVHGKTKASKQQIREALEGNLSEHHRFMLQTIRRSIEGKEIIKTELEKRIDLMAEKYSVEVELLETIDGVGHDSAIAIIGEIGTDMSQYPDENHLSSLGGVSPGNNESAGKKKVHEPSKEISI